MIIDLELSSLYRSYFFCLPNYLGCPSENRHHYKDSFVVVQIKCRHYKGLFLITCISNFHVAGQQYLFRKAILTTYSITGFSCFVNLFGCSCASNCRLNKLVSRYWCARRMVAFNLFSLSEILYVGDAAELSKMRSDDGKTLSKTEDDDNSIMSFVVGMIWTRPSFDTLQ